MVKSVVIWLLTAVLSLSVITTVSAHYGGGKNGVQQCLDHPGAFTQSHCRAHFESWVANNHDKFISENPNHPEYPPLH